MWPRATASAGEVESGLVNHLTTVNTVSGVFAPISDLAAIVPGTGRVEPEAVLPVLQRDGPHLDPQSRPRAERPLYNRWLEHGHQSLRPDVVLFPQRYGHLLDRASSQDRP